MMRLKCQACQNIEKFGLNNFEIVWHVWVYVWLKFFKANQLKKYLTFFTLSLLGMKLNLNVLFKLEYILFNFQHLWNNIWKIVYTKNFIICLFLQFKFSKIKQKTLWTGHTLRYHSGSKNLKKSSPTQLIKYYKFIPWYFLWYPKKLLLEI